ncbi:MAG: alkaline phosphatase family protein [Actinomycetes bacterium]
MSGPDPDFLGMLDGDGVTDPSDALRHPSRLSVSDRRLGQFAAVALVSAGLVVGLGLSDRNPSIAALLGKPKVVSVNSPTAPTSLPPVLAAPLGPPIVETVFVQGDAPPAAQPTPQPPVAPPAVDPEPDPPAPKPSGPKQKPRSKINHVALVVLPATDSRSGWPAAGDPQAPYMADTLRDEGTLLAEYRSVGRSDLSNRIALLSGQQPNVDTEAGCPTFKPFARPFSADGNGLVAGDGCYYPYDQKSTQIWTVPDGLSRQGRQWKGYIGDADRAPETGKPGISGCRRPATGEMDGATVATKEDGFLTRHDPLVYFQSLFETATCDPNFESNDVPLTRLAEDIAADRASGGNPSKLPAFSLIVPTACDGGLLEDCGVDPATKEPNPTGLAAVNAFLEREVKPLIESPSFRKDGLVIVVFDRSHRVDDAPRGEPGSGPVGALLVGPFVKKGAESRVSYNHYSTLASVQDLLGLWKIGRARNNIEGKPQLNSFCSDVFAVDPFDRTAPCRLGPAAG